jgi:hypothetical protein
MFAPGLKRRKKEKRRTGDNIDSLAAKRIEKVNRLGPILLERLAKIEDLSRLALGHDKWI